MFFQASVEGGGQAPEEPGVGPMGFELMSDWRGMLDERYDGVQCRRPGIRRRCLEAS